jgi:RND superfamily putative drug exporter
MTGTLEALIVLTRLASACARRAWIVVAVWIVVLIAGAVSAPVLFGRLTSEAGVLDDSESRRARQVLAEADPSGPQIYAVADGRSVDDPRLRASIEQVAATVRRHPGVAAVLTPWSSDSSEPASRPGAAQRAPAPEAVSKDGRAVGVAVRFEASPTGGNAIGPVSEQLRSIQAPRIIIGGGPLLGDDMDAQAGSDLARAELFSTPVVLLLLLIVFGGLVAAGLPVLLMIVAVVSTMGLLLTASLLTDVSVYAVNIVTMLGLGLAVDYALLIVTRFRQERALDLPTTSEHPGSTARCVPTAAIRRTFASAGRTVTFSGLTVAASLAALLVFPDDFLRSMGIAGLAVVLLDLLAALTLLPALLGLLGHRIRAATPRTSDGQVFVSVVRAVRRRPLLVLSVSAVLLLASAAPFLGARFAYPDERSLPASAPSRLLFELQRERFEVAPTTDPVTVVARTLVPAQQLAAYTEQLRLLPGVSTVTVRDGVPGLTVIDLTPGGADENQVAKDLVTAVRALRAPMPVEVTGKAATLLDYQNALRARSPWALAILLLATFVLLFLFTGSVVLPIKAILTNLLSLGAGFGSLVWVFQDGHLGGLVGSEALGALSITTPVLVFAIAFGLSMDYEVFLLGRIAENYRRTGDNDLAVEEGLRDTGAVITQAALLMAVVFAAFVAGGFSPVKQVGFGLMLTVLIDATLVRMLVVPAFMTVMGPSNWWSPLPLRRLHARVGLHEHSPEPEDVLAPNREPLSASR